MDQLHELPGDRTASRFAYAAAAGAAGVLTLGAMYAVEVPRGGPYYFGTTNDALGGAFSLLIIPVILQVHRRVPKEAWTEPAKWVVVGACVAGSASSFLLVFRVLDFVPSTVVTVAAMIVQAGWFLLAHNKLRTVEGYPRSLATLGRFIGLALLTGLALAGVGYLLPGPDWLKWSVVGVGITAGAAAWVAWPYWYFKAARHLSHAAESQLRAGTPPPSPAV